MGGRGGLERRVRRGRERGGGQGRAVGKGRNMWCVVARDRWDEFLPLLLLHPHQQKLRQERRRRMQQEARWQG